MTGFTKRQNGVAGTATSGLTVSATLGSNPTTGDTLCVGVLFYDGTTTAPTFTVQDGNSNNYTVESHNTGATNMADAGYLGQAYLVNAPANADKVITVTFSKACSIAAVWVDDFAVSGGTSAYDNGAVGNGATAITTPTIPVAGSNELLYCVVADSTDVGAANSPWTGVDGGNQFGCWAGYDLSASSNTAVNFAGSGGGTVYNAIGMSFSFTASSGLKRPNTVLNQAVQRAAYW